MEVNPMSERISELRDIAKRRPVSVAVGVFLTVFAIVGLLFPKSVAGDLLGIVLREGTLRSTLTLSVPIAFAALGGIFSEKSGVINIGLEGHLIIAAFVAVYGVNLTGSIWLGFLIGVLASTLFALLFAIVCIEFKADQIIAGLAVWLVALGLAPFLSTVLYNSKNASIEQGGFETLSVPVLSSIPYVGVLFEATLPVYLLFVAVALSWYVLNRTSFGRWVRASGENPTALDTVGVNVTRVRYVSVLLSGVLSGIGGASLSIGLGRFVGSGQTMVNGRGFIAIVAYLLGNYNPIGAFLSSGLFAGLNAIETPLQTAGYPIPKTLIQIVPHLTVILVLALVGYTRIPKAAGEHYESGEE